MRTPPPRNDLRFSNTTGILPNKKTMWFIGVEVEQETSAPPPKKNPGSAPVNKIYYCMEMYSTRAVLAPHHTLTCLEAHFSISLLQIL